MAPSLWPFGFVITALITGSISQVPDQQHGCSQGSCYPATGDLLVGRADKLKSTSTCGLRRAQPYCIVSHLQDEKKCFVCDSRKPYNPLYNPISHRIENVITTFAPHRKKAWWQSENGVSEVAIQLDLEAEFHFTHLIMTFKTFRPAAMLVERSADFGRTWQIYRYFAHDCASSFPNVSRSALRKVDDVICESRYSDIEPSMEGEVIYRVLDPAIQIRDPYGPNIQNLLKITNLRINFTKLHTLGDNLLDSRVEIKEKYYYALYELVVRGNCFCYGHASECAPIEGLSRDVEGMVHGRCVCKHNTKGLNCEQCDGFFNDHPWRPAEGRSTNACKKCNCNNHSHKCHFDMAVYLSTGNVTGGVCDDCVDNTMGQNCELCKPFFYKDPSKDIRNSAVCKACDCDPDGSLDGGLCDAQDNPALGLIAGQCRCKDYVEGPRCDRCKTGFFGLSANNFQGCQRCQCDPRGTISDGAQCDPISGDCFCKRFVTGPTCNQCLPEFWALSNDLHGCRSCDCDVGGAWDNHCATETGQCRCRSHMVGRQCNQVKSGYYRIHLDHYTYEAESALHRQGCSVLERERPLGRPATWTGPGFALVPEGGILEFQISNVPYSMEYDVIIRYEPQLSATWEQVKISVIRPGPIPTSSPCGNTIPADDLMVASLPPGTRHVVLPQPVCLEHGVSYTIRLEFSRYSLRERVPGASILVDSLVLVPRYAAMEMFIAGDPASIQRKDTFESYRCHSNSGNVIKSPTTEECTGLITSMSAIIHDGALPCSCDPQGSLSSECDPNGGQCQCKTGLIGQRCDRCAPGTYGFGPTGCRECECNKEGSSHNFCDPHTGQCPCRPGAFSSRCDRCQPGHWGFPNCRQCQCNGHSEECDQRTGACLTCRDHSTGDRCERCIAGFFGNPVRGSGDHCRPCPCPEGPNSGRHFAASCHQDPRSRQVICNCKQGYSGLVKRAMSLRRSRCDECSPGFFGNPFQTGGRCLLCQCNNNIDMTDIGACDRRNGQCIKCMFNTEGRFCEQCRIGFYGDASRRNCRKCTCNYLGTEPNQCPSREDCMCDRTSGQCHCLPNVMGQNCDRCSPNFWNMASGKGCQPCNCDPNHSFSLACNEFTGTCLCRPGFGGITCTDCQENYWGNPNIQCRACDCDGRGIKAPQCNRATGHCLCRAGVSGVRCDQCARGFSGQFPDCQPCHQCFGDWDRIVQDLATRTKSLVQRGKDIQLSGVAGVYQKNFRDIEKKLAKAQSIVNSRNATVESVTKLMKIMDDLRNKINESTEALTQLEVELTAVQDENFDANHDLAELERDARSLNMTAKERSHQLDVLKNSNFLGAYDSIQQSHAKSRQAEKQANNATSNVPSPVSHSAGTREKAQQLITHKRDDFNRKNAANRLALNDLAAKTDTLDIKKINEKVCGAPGDAPCSESPCGGAGCRDDEGKRHCGGLNCNGAVATADNALVRARHAEEELQKALGEVEVIFRKVAAAKIKADRAKQRAQATLDRANETKARVEQSNKELRELIQQIKDFLNQEGADPDSIEMVASRVLDLTIPATPQQIQSLAEEIKDRVKTLANVDAILDQTATDVRKAEQLLHEAKRAKNRAENVKNTAESVKKALDDARRAQNAAEGAIQTANHDIKDTERKLTAIQTATSSAENHLNNAMDRVGNLDKQIDALKMKRANNSLAASRTEESATAALDKANDAKKILEGQLADKYKTVQNVVDWKAKNIKDAKTKADQLQDEAKKLLENAQDKLKRLQDLEVEYTKNEKLLQDKAKQINGLEDKMKKILHAINQQIQIYNTCQ
ncbi:laminin subunit beta-2 isoform X1 [Xenopus laevis]|uniref:Laminin subunit beta-2 isoform X1 n=1 Tax=Xenopus laevis TaxID=8355 RepID=A0A8J1KN58_XENLA|nr:laminin subunit beta-2 isoform X1 [Xenopus laevis]